MYKIIVADDNIDFLGVMKLSLEGEGYEIKTASSKRDLLLGIKNFRPHLILLDVFLDKFDGRQICKEINDSQKTCHIPTIIFSANPYSLTHYDYYGADDFIEKPLSLPILFNKIEKLLRN